MQKLESFTHYISKLDTKWKKVDSLIKSEYPDVTLTHASDRSSYQWRFTVDFNKSDYVLVRITYYSSIVNKSSINLHVNSSIGNGVYNHDLKYEDFMANGLKKIKIFVETSYKDLDKYKTRSKNKDEEEKRKQKEALKNLTDELSQEDLEEILSDINDLSIVTYNINTTKYKMNTRTGDYDISVKYVINFDTKENIDTLDEYSEFFKILSNSIKRIKNTYNVNVKWQSNKALIISAIDETS